jgi:hypothetical protein
MESTSGGVMQGDRRLETLWSVTRCLQRNVLPGGWVWDSPLTCQVLSGTDSEERRYSPFASELPLENGCHFGRRSEINRLTVRWRIPMLPD